MKSDSSRTTFDGRKHYSSVRMQQGRVQLDADWNEQVDIAEHRASSEATDVIGRCGGPLHDAAFHVVSAIAQLTAEEQARPENQTPPPGFKAPDFLIGSGRYYVDGIPSENPGLTSYLTQPDFPNPSPITGAGLYVVYLDVWQRHITALDDPAIREIALGGPDTATREKVVWQVRLWFAGAAPGNCATAFPGLDAQMAASTATLRARTQPSPQSTNPCSVPPGAGYRGLENQLYRVEIHDGGTPIDAAGGGAGTLMTRVPGIDNQVKFSSGSWTAGQAIEIFSNAAGSDALNGTLAHVVAADSGAKTLTLDVHVTDLPIDELRVRPARATYKWSRDNGAITTTIERIKGPELLVHDLGPDAVLGFNEGVWVEISDDRLELNGLPGQLARIVAIDRTTNLITLNITPQPLDASPSGVDTTRHPKLRRWDGVGAVKIHSGLGGEDFLDIEDGVQVRFADGGTSRTGDYWTITARTATADTQSGNIDWPVDTAGKPLALTSFGITHHYCRLAMLDWDGTTFTAIEDCRHLFPPITELTTLLYVSGDGQEAMPGNPLPQLLQAGVFNGEWPVAGAEVLFVAAGAGHVATTVAGTAASTTNTIVVTTGADGVASCGWKLEPDVTKPSQHVEARLLNANGDPLPPIVGFNGTLSVAAEVFYDPGSCASMAGRGTVQQAIEQLADLVSLYELSGKSQEVMPGAVLEPLRVLAANRCGPVANQHISFKVTAGSGTIAPADAVTAADGTATATWTLDPSTPVQHVDAALVDGSPISVAAPTVLRFTANLSIASQVSYTPTAACPDLVAANVTTVQEALDTLCKQSAGADPGIVIKGVTTDADGKPLVNDTLVPVSRLHGGIRVVCDAALDPRSFGPSPAPPSGFPDAVAEKPTCFVTLDLPYPVGSDRTFWDFNDTVGFERIVIACTTVVNNHELLWKPTAAADRWLQTVLFKQLVVGKVADRVLARLTLKGNFIFGAKETDNLVYLDGEAFGIRGASGRTGLRLPSGNERTGGDFESWFWLAPPDGSFVLDAVVIQSSIQGSIRDSSGAAIPGVQVTALATQLAQTFTAVTDASGKFVFVNLTAGIYQVTAQVGGVVLQKTLTVEI